MSKMAAQRRVFGVIITLGHALRPPKCLVSTATTIFVDVQAYISSPFIFVQGVSIL